MVSLHFQTEDPSDYTEKSHDLILYELTLTKYFQLHVKSTLCYSNINLMCVFNMCLFLYKLKVLIV